jgi:predicted N-formylglutamate amidohydrolase
MSDLHRASTLLGGDDPAPVRRVPAHSDVPMLIVCDHAGHHVPCALDDLGLPARELRRHIGWDIGALDIANRLAERTGAGVVASVYSRLVIDANRYPADPMSIAATSDGTEVPGNRGVDPIARERRVLEIFRPYHDAVEHALDRLVAQVTTPLLLSVHTMTDRIAGRSRPMHVTVCWTHDDTVARVALAALRRLDGVVVADNDPYAVDIGVDYTVPEHGLRRGLPVLMLELRQDLVATPATAAAWADRLVPMLEAVLADPDAMAPRRVWP